MAGSTRVRQTPDVGRRNLFITSSGRVSRPGGMCACPAGNGKGTCALCDVQGYERPAAAGLLRIEPEHEMTARAPLLARLSVRFGCVSAPALAADYLTDVASEVYQANGTAKAIATRASTCISQKLKPGRPTRNRSSAPTSTGVSWSLEAASATLTASCNGRYVVHSPLKPVTAVSASFKRTWSGSISSGGRSASGRVPAGRKRKPCL